MDSGRILRFSFASGPGPGFKIYKKNWTRIRGHISISAVAEVSVIISYVTTWVIPVGSMIVAAI